MNKKPTSVPSPVLVFPDLSAQLGFPGGKVADGQYLQWDQFAGVRLPDILGYMVGVRTEEQALSGYAYMFKAGDAVLGHALGALSNRRFELNSSNAPIYRALSLADFALCLKGGYPRIWNNRLIIGWKSLGVWNGSLCVPCLDCRSRGRVSWWSIFAPPPTSHTVIFSEV